LTFPIQFSDRVKRLPPYLFVELDAAKRRAKGQGKDIIDLGVGDPDLPTPAPIIAALAKAAKDPRNHRYALDQGLPELRRAIQRWCHDRFGVSLDPDQEILPLIGSKEGIAHLPLGLVNPKDAVLVPDPCYPPYRSGTLFAGGEVVSLPLFEENGFRPDFSTVKRATLKKAKLLFLNYPNNPTGATADPSFFDEAIDISRRHRIMICHDAAYTEIAFDGFRPTSFLERPGAKAVGIEFHSLSKSYNMTGWRIGFACGRREMVAALAKVKANIDSGIFQAVQLAGIAALRMSRLEIEKRNRIYEERRDLLVGGLHRLGWRVPKPRASFYVWARVPVKRSSGDFAKWVLNQTGIVVTPGVGFGPSGEGYVRMALTVPKQRIEEACRRLRKLLG